MYTRSQIKNISNSTGRPHKYSNVNFATPLQLSGTSSVLHNAKITQYLAYITITIVRLFKLTVNTYLPNITEMVSDLTRSPAFRMVSSHMFSNFVVAMLFKGQKQVTYINNLLFSLNIIENTSLLGSYSIYRSLGYQTTVISFTSNQNSCTVVFQFSKKLHEDLPLHTILIKREQKRSVISGFYSIKMLKKVIMENEGH